MRMYSSFLRRRRLCLAKKLTVSSLQPFRVLHGSQEATTLSHVLPPPLPQNNAEALDYNNELCQRVTSSIHFPPPHASNNLDATD